ncbi:MAG TPA: hypothetical protein VFQ45_10415 [Longimicrobium sp.]|nr:hypothetical protein [Longimicrobium sp.]
MMSRSRILRRAACLLPVAAASLLMATSCEQPMSPEEEYVRAQATVARWVNLHPDAWETELSGWPLKRPGSSAPCRQNPPAGTVVLRYGLPQTEIDLHFRCPLDASSTAQDLAAAFQFAVLTRLPHGMWSPGWEYELLTPTSTITEGVAFPTPTGPRQLRVEIRTPMYAIHARSTRPSCQPPQDAPAIEGCYLSRPHGIPLRISMTVEFRASALE